MKVAGLLFLAFVGSLGCLTQAASGTHQARWLYTTQADKMTSKDVAFASIKSQNSLKMDFPYHGENYGRLVVRQDPEEGLNVYIRVDKGQIVCNSYQGCNLTVRFDDSKPTKFSGTGSADHSSDIVFIENEQRFVNAARKAKRILVSMTYFHAGDQVLEFVTDEPLKWPSSKPATARQDAASRSSRESAPNAPALGNADAAQAEKRRAAYLQELLDRAGSAALSGGTVGRKP